MKHTANGHGDSIGLLARMKGGSARAPESMDALPPEGALKALHEIEQIRSRGEPRAALERVRGQSRHAVKADTGGDPMDPPGMRRVIPDARVECYLLAGRSI